MLSGTRDQDPRYVLFVHGEPDHARTTCEFFRIRGIDATHAEHVDDARELLARSSFDQVVLDASSDHRAAMGLVAELGASAAGCPIILLSDLSSVPDRVRGLELGADDYLVTPCDLHELLARMRAVHRRYRRSHESRTWRQKAVRVDHWSIDLHTRRATHDDGHVVELTAGEFGLLQVLLEHAGEVLTRERLAALTHRDAGEVFLRSIDVLVGRLRRKLTVAPHELPLIQTVRGAGYRVTAIVTWR